MVTKQSVAAYNNQPWGTLTRKDIHVGDIVTVRWKSVPDEAGIITELEEHPSNYKGDQGGSARFQDGAGSFDTVKQIIEVRGSVLPLLRGETTLT